MHLPTVTIACFASSYAIALALDMAGAQLRMAWSRAVGTLFVGLGVLLHLLYLAGLAGTQAAPLASPADWYLLVALVVAGLQLVTRLWAPKWTLTLFLLPVVLALIGVSLGVSQEPLALAGDSPVWSKVHAMLLVLAAATVSIGFVAGVAYLVQSWRLRRRLSPSSWLPLPSLESLERANGRCLGLSTVFLTGGLVTGLGLAIAQHRGEAGYRLVTDPAVLSLTAMWVWLVVAEVFRWFYPAARRGRKVAYLTLASFGFLVLTLVVTTYVESAHHAGAELTSVTPQSRAEGTP